MTTYLKSLRGGTRPYHFIYLSIVALFFITIHNLAYFFSVLEGTAGLMTYLSAGIFDLAVLWVSWYIREVSHSTQTHKRSKVAALWLVIFLCTGVSVVGNLVFVMTHTNFSAFGPAEHLPWSPAYPYIGAGLPVLTLIFTLIAQMASGKAPSLDEIKQKNAEKLALAREKADYRARMQQIAPTAGESPLVTTAETVNRALTTLLTGKKAASVPLPPINPRAGQGDLGFIGGRGQQDETGPQDAAVATTAGTGDSSDEPQPPDEPNRAEERDTDPEGIPLPKYNTRQSAYVIGGITYWTYTRCAKEWKLPEQALKRACEYVLQEKIAYWCVPLPYMTNKLVYLVEVGQKATVKATLTQMNRKGVLTAARKIPSPSGTSSVIHLVPSETPPDPQQLAQ